MLTFECWPAVVPFVAAAAAACCCTRSGQLPVFAVGRIDSMLSEVLHSSCAIYGSLDQVVELASVTELEE